MTTRTSRPTVSSATAKKAKELIKSLLSTPLPAEQETSISGAADHTREKIASRAYALYEERGYRQGCDLQDWLDAEREILSRQQPV